MASVSQYNGMPFLHEAKWEKGDGLKPKRLTQDAIYNGRRTRVIKLELGLPLYDGDSLETPGDASMELLFPTGDMVLVHPGSLVELQDAPSGVEVRRGRVTLLTVSAGVSALVLSANGQRFDSLVTGAFVDVGDKGVTQGNELRAQEFVGFDDLNIQPAEAVRDSAVVPVHRDENPLDDTGDEPTRLESGTTPSSKGYSASEAARVGSSVAMEKGWFSFAAGKVIDTSNDALAAKVWSLHGNGGVWLARSLGIEAAFDFFPHAKAGSPPQVRSHARWNATLGLRFSSPRDARVRFFLTPLLGVVALRGAFEVGAARDGSRVFSDVAIGPNMIYGLRTGADTSFGSWRVGGSGFGTVRYSSDKVILRHLGVEGNGGYAFVSEGNSAATPVFHVFLFSRYEAFRTEKSLGSLGQKDVETSWSLLGLGAGFFL
jgi:hypothetical protein